MVYRRGTVSWIRAYYGRRAARVRSTVPRRNRTDRTRGRDIVRMRPTPVQWKPPADPSGRSCRLRRRRRRVDGGTTGVRKGRTDGTTLLVAVLYTWPRPTQSLSYSLPPCIYYTYIYILYTAEFIYIHTHIIHIYMGF